jgi:hypothetical protein
VAKKLFRRGEGPTLDEKEIIGIDHPLITEAIVDKLVPKVSIPLPILKRVGYLLTHPIEFEQTSFAEVKMIAAQLNAALDVDVRAAQERNVKATGKARP